MNKTNTVVFLKLVFSVILCVIIYCCAVYLVLVYHCNIKNTIFYCILLLFLFLEPEKMRIFLDILLELKDSGATFTDDDLRDEVVTMMVGVSKKKTIYFFLEIIILIHEC